MMDFGERLFRGQWSVGPFHCYPFTLTKRGSHTILHAHEHDHLISASRPIAVYRGLSLLDRSLGHEEIIPIGAGDRRIIAAHTEHLIVALEDGGTDVECLFSRYDARGAFLADPKESSRMPYREPCDPANLPPPVLAMLERDHGVTPIAA